MKRFTATFTRPNTTTPYTAGDVMNNSVTAPVIMTFTNIADSNGRGGVLLDAQMTISSNDTLKGSFELWLFKTTAAQPLDNAAFIPTAARMLDLVAVIPLSLAFVGNAGVGILGTVAYQGSLSAPIVFEAAATDVNLYGVLVVRNAYVPVALSVVSVTLCKE